MKLDLVTLVTQVAQGHKARLSGRCPSPEKVLRSECRRENQALAPTTDAAGLAESLNACGAAGKTGSPALGNEAGTHLKEEAISRIREGIPALQGEEEVNQGHTLPRVGFASMGLRPA